MTGIGHPAAAVPRTSPPPPRPFRMPRVRRRTLTTLIVVGAVGLVAFNVGRQAFVGWSVGQEAASLEAQVAAAEAENATLQRQLEYLQSDAYVTAEARRLRNLGYPGEQILIIPPGASVPSADAGQVPAPEDRPLLERWIELFFGR
ncbi:MAG: septum formation initiator family protein [Candidatus Limnocylindria bacterium]